MIRSRECKQKITLSATPTFSSFLSNQTGINAKTQIPFETNQNQSQKTLTITQKNMIGSRELKQMTMFLIT